LQSDALALLSGIMIGDIRFLGSPVDLVVFDGLAEGQVRRLIFVEVKSGRSTHTPPF
jgi:predicted Holliday junction resolvase-like endonuclease